MSKSTHLICDRCKKRFIGEKYPGATSGYYEISENSIWKNFSNPGEKILCDDCMFHDERYIEVYGKHF